MPTLTVLMNAGPWLPVPPNGYGGIENVIAALIPELRRRGVRIVLSTVGTSTLPVDDMVVTFADGQFAQLQQPYNRAAGIVAAHMHQVAQELARRPEIDVVHDHVEAWGPVVLAAGSPVPVLHTLHWDLAKHPELYGSFDAGGRVFVNGVSASQMNRAPDALRAHSVGHVYLPTPLATDADQRPLPAKGDHGVILGRITHSKGQHIAARMAHVLGERLVLAGPVGPYYRPADLHAALNEPDGVALSYPDVRYWLEEVAPHVDGDRVQWIGTVAGAERDRLVATARATLFPLLWEEPGGTAVVESLALGTPVIGLSRGCLPELVDQGVTGLLADDEDGLAEAWQLAGRIDPRACTWTAARRFTPAKAADAYLALYEQIRSVQPPTDDLLLEAPVS
ncbi:glycosyltransferase [Cryptosporangium aurantiacum]|uniref:Glycosyltransferase involved in cell wall bisynthesis n=1 Tax=Cryptosporangium aurantiacum TaxID=134849 RepID=A0A1M7RNC7_9ACTN|nr:glycosyltransferase [Cryptosporangium aurantiacum]SHN47582.1 Glycosyltransferase involved in cell wall bisynthesis [Cryptosporangium aurantiacum]